MRLNQDCIRALLLTIEDATFEELVNEIDIDEFSSKPLLEKFAEDDIKYTALLLHQAGYISARHQGYDSTLNMLFTVSGITWQGHRFLDTVRDNKVWSDTKSVVSKFSSVSISMVETIASNVITQLINKQLGL